MDHAQFFEFIIDKLYFFGIRRLINYISLDSSLIKVSVGTSRLRDEILELSARTKNNSAQRINWKYIESPGISFSSRILCRLSPPRFYLRRVDCFLFRARENVALIAIGPWNTFFFPFYSIVIRRVVTHALARAKNLGAKLRRVRWTRGEKYTPVLSLVAARVISGPRRWMGAPARARLKTKVRNSSRPRRRSIAASSDISVENREDAITQRSQRVRETSRTTIEGPSEGRARSTLPWAFLFRKMCTYARLGEGFEWKKKKNFVFWKDFAIAIFSRNFICMW